MFIKLHYDKDQPPVRISVDHIVSYCDYTWPTSHVLKGTKGSSVVTDEASDTDGGQPYWLVLETPDEIDRLIDQPETAKGTEVDAQRGES